MILIPLAIVASVVNLPLLRALGQATFQHVVVGETVLLLAVLGVAFGRHGPPHDWEIGDYVSHALVTGFFLWIYSQFVLIWGAAYFGGERLWQPPPGRFFLYTGVPSFVVYVIAYRIAYKRAYRF